MFRTRSWAFLHLSVELPLCCGRSGGLRCEVIVNDLRGVSVGVEGKRLRMSWFFIGFMRSLASMCGWIDSVDVTKVPTDTTFAFKISGSSLPGAVRAINSSVAIIDFQLHVLGINLPLAIRAGNESTDCHVDVRNVGLVWLRRPICFLPSGGAFEVYLSERGLGSHRCVAGTMFARISMVVLVKLEHTFEFLLGSSFSLS